MACLKQQAAVMISKGPHLTDRPAECRTSLTNELLNISPSHLGLLLLQLPLFIYLFISTLVFTLHLLFCITSSFFLKKNPKKNKPFSPSLPPAFDACSHVHESTAPPRLDRLISSPGRPTRVLTLSTVVGGWRGHQLCWERRGCRREEILLTRRGCL